MSRFMSYISTAPGLAVTYRVINPITKAEVTPSTNAVAGEGNEYLTAAAIPNGLRVKWYESGVFKDSEEVADLEQSDISLIIAQVQSAAAYGGANNTLLTNASSGTVALRGAIDTKPTLAQMEASSKLSHIPTGWIQWGNTSPGMSVTTDDHGNILTNVLIDAFYQADVGHTTPINSTNSGVGGVWSLPLPAGLYDLVFQLPGQTSVTVKVTVA